MSETYTPPPTNDQQKEPNYALRRTVAGGIILGASAAAAGGIIFGPEIVKNETEGTPVASTTFELSQTEGHDNVIGAAEDAVQELALQKGIDPAAIPHDSLVYASQDAADQANKLHGTSVNQPGDEFNLTLYKITTGYRIDIEPSKPQVQAADEQLPLPPAIDDTIPAPETH